MIYQGNAEGKYLLVHPLDMLGPAQLASFGIGLGQIGPESAMGLSPMGLGLGMDLTRDSNAHSVADWQHFLGCITYFEKSSCLSLATAPQ